MSIVAFLLPCCDLLWPDVYWRSGHYVVMEIDDPGQMNLGFDDGTGGSMVVVDPTVFAVGGDSRYIVLKQHPASDWFGHYNRKVTNYFIVERNDSSNFGEQRRHVTGPFSEQEFRVRADSLKLPVFQKVFHDLE